MCPGVTLFTAMGSRAAFLIDANREIVHRWDCARPSAGAVALLENGDLLRAVHETETPVVAGGGQGGRMEELDWDGKVVWDFALANEHYLQHHGFERTPYGTVLLLAWERKSAEEALAAGRDPERLRAGGLWSEVVVEVEPKPPAGGQILWEWHVWDHLVQDRFPSRANHGEIREHLELLDINADVSRSQPEDPAMLADLRAVGYTGSGEAVADPARDRRGLDWIHANSVAYDPEGDRILVGSRDLCEVWVIDHSTSTREAAGHGGGRRGRGGDFLARWGNPRNYGNERDRRLFQPHDAQWIPYGLPGQGDLLVFNNGPQPVLGRASEVLEIRLPEPGAPPSAAAPARSVEPEIVWRCVAVDGASFFSSLLSGAQRLPNGNTLITIGVQGRLVEVTKEGDIVWEYQHRPQLAEPTPSGTPEGAKRPLQPAAIFRATRLLPDHPGLARLTPKR